MFKMIFFALEIENNLINEMIMDKIIPDTIFLLGQLVKRNGIVIIMEFGQFGGSWPGHVFHRLKYIHFMLSLRDKHKDNYQELSYFTVDLEKLLLNIITAYNTTYNLDYYKSQNYNGRYIETVHIECLYKFISVVYAFIVYFKNNIRQNNSLSQLIYSRLEK